MNEKWLLAWQFGDNLGHLRGLSAIARARAADSGASFIATPDLDKVPQGLRHGFRGDWLCGPPEPKPPALSAELQRRYALDKGLWTYAQWLMLIGFNDVDYLSWQIAAWCRLITALAPDRVVINHSPLALIAACALKQRVTHVGTGFTCPPPSLPPFRTWESPVPQAVADLPSLINERLTQALHLLGLPPLCMQEVLATPTALWTLPELDHYESRSGHTQLSYVGALSDSAGTAFYPWPEQRSGAAKKRVVMYARQEHSGVKELINALCQRDDVALRAYVPGVQVRLNPPNPDIVFSQTPLELSKMLVGADLFIGYAGASTSALALQLGVPMLFLPQHAEQFSTAHRLHLAGVAEWLRPERGSIPFALMLEKVLNNTQAKIRAEQIAQTHTDKPIAESAARLVHNIQSTPTRAN